MENRLILIKKRRGRGRKVELDYSVIKLCNNNYIFSNVYV